MAKGNTDTAAILDDVMGAMAALDHDKLADAIRLLIAIEPDKWQSRLLVSGAFPQPSPKQSGKASRRNSEIACLMQAMASLLRNNNQVSDAVFELVPSIAGMLHLQSIFSSIEERLSQLDFFNDPVEVQILRLLAFIESQHQNAERKLREMESESPYISVMQGYAAAVTLESGESESSISQALEGTCENIELILRFILHTRSLPTSMNFDVAVTPYQDPEISLLLGLAANWRLAEFQWANVKFRNWTWSTDPNMCRPVDTEEFIRECAGNLRYQISLQESVLHRMLDEQEVVDNREIVSAIAATLNVPDFGNVWDGQLDFDSLKELSKNPYFSIVVDEYVNQRHYGPILNAAKVGTLGWRSWLDGKNALFNFAEIVATALSHVESTNEQLKDSTLSSVMLCREQDLVSLLIATTELTPAEAFAFIDTQRFDPKKQRLEIWDQPLIPIEVGIVVISPAIVKSGNPARALENFVGQSAIDLFDRRGTPFEKHIADKLNQQEEVIAAQGVKVPIVIGQELEFDVIAFWRGYVLLVEAKCSKAVFDPSDFHRAKRQIEKSIDQLIHRRSKIQSVWEDIRKKAPELGLPEAFVGLDHVICISVTNIMEFTGYYRDGVVVTDDSCLTRFFQDQFVVGVPRPLSGDDDRETPPILIMEPIRGTKEPRPEQLVNYLRKPVQMRRFTDQITLVNHMAPGIDDGKQAYRYVGFNFNPENSLGATSWAPLFVNKSVYSTANRLFKTGFSVTKSEVQTDSSLASDIQTLIDRRVIGYQPTSTPFLFSKYVVPVLLETPDGRFAIGDNSCGQFDWWLSKEFPKATVVFAHR